MPNRSWLAKAQTLNDLGVTFYNSTDEKPWSDEREALVEKKWLELMDRPLPVDERDRPYFGSRLHDSGVLGIERTTSVLRIGLDNINARDFAGYLADIIEKPLVDAIWPVELQIEDPAYVRAARVELRGGLRFVDWSRLDNLELLYDWFFEQDERIQWIVHLWDHQPHVPRNREVVYLMIDGKSASAVDHCFEVFSRHYGDAAAELYRDAVLRIDERSIDFNVYDGGRKTEAYIRRRMAARGLTPADFRPACPAPDRDPSARD